MANFPIGCWTYFPISKAWDTLAKDYHDLGLTNPMTPVFKDGDDPEKMIRLLDQFHELGMQVIVFDDRVTAHVGEYIDEASYRARFKKSLEQFGGHPAVMGFYVSDEPDAPDAANYFRAARIQREMAPNLMPYLNLLPWFDWIGERMGSPTYAPYLDRAIQEGNLAQVGYDCYTQMWEGDRGYHVYFDNLREMRDASNRHNIPFCTTLLSSGHYEYECPDQDAFRWQISTAAALGAKAITYFYVAGINPGCNYRRFPINHFHERTEAYHWLSEENRLFQEKHASLLLELKCIKSEFTVKEYGGLTLFQPDDTLLDAHTNQGINLLVSTFEGPDGIRYRVIVNVDRKKNVEAKMSFASGVKVHMQDWDNQWTYCGGVTDAVGARTLDGATVSVWLAPGQMEIFRELNS